MFQYFEMDLQFHVIVIFHGLDDFVFLRFRHRMRNNDNDGFTVRQGFLNDLVKADLCSGKNLKKKKKLAVRAAAKRTLSNPKQSKE